MITAKLRKSGNSFIVTVPKEEVERLRLKEGQLVALQVQPVEVRPVMSDEVREAFEIELRKGQAGLRYLAEH